jgi:hypothetical protein
MKIFTAVKQFIWQHFTVNKIIVALGFIAATVLILSTPLQMPDPDDWAYNSGVKNFSQGHFTLSNAAYMLQAKQVGQQGGILLQYLHIDHDKWVLEKAPGCIFYLIPFYKMGIPRWSNVILALGMVIVTFILLKRLRDEKAAMVGSLLILFTPISMVMMNRIYMDTYSSLALLVIGGGLYLYYHLERASVSAWKGGILLFLAFFFISWSVVARFTNLPIAVILALHLVITRIFDLCKKQGARIKFEILPVILGIGIPLAGMLVYDYFVFGSAIKTGYSFSPYPIKFAFQYLGQVDANGVSIPDQIISYNVQGALRNTLIGFPLLLIGIPAFCIILYQLIGILFKWRGTTGKLSTLRSEMTWDVFLVMTGWFLAVFLLYLMYEWTAGLKQGGGFVLFNRFYLPMLFPIVVICALVMARFPYKILIPVMLVFVVWGSLMYAQWALNLHILPDWLTVRTLETWWPGYIFPPWTPAGIQYYTPPPG